MARRRTLTRVQPFDRVFGRDDKLTNATARAAVLYHDLRLEVACMYPDRLPVEEQDVFPDEIGTAFRRVYFLRRAVATLYEFSTLMTTLRRSKEWLSGVDAIRGLRPQWDAADRFFVQNEAELRRYRHAFGGHVDARLVGDALRLRADGDQAVLEIVEDVDGRRMARYKFAHTIASRMLVQSPPEQAGEQFQVLWRLTSDAIGHVGACMECLFAVVLRPRFPA